MRRGVSEGVLRTARGPAARSAAPGRSGSPVTLFPGHAGGPASLGDEIEPAPLPGRVPGPASLGDDHSPDATSTGRVDGSVSPAIAQALAAATGSSPRWSAESRAGRPLAGRGARSDRCGPRPQGSTGTAGRCAAQTWGGLRAGGGRQLCHVACRTRCRSRAGPDAGRVPDPMPDPMATRRGMSDDEGGPGDTPVSVAWLRGEGPRRSRIAHPPRIARSRSAPRSAPRITTSVARTTSWGSVGDARRVERDLPRRCRKWRGRAGVSRPPRDGPRRERGRRCSGGPGLRPAAPGFLAAQHYK